jgi:CheY-like chemotaxis protein
MLDRILGNLISNALNHAPGASVSLRIEDVPGAGLTLSVTDGGPGYPQAVLDRVGRGDDPAPMGSRAGSGLGLRIAGELSRQIGGRLRLANAPNGGGAAQLHLPELVLDWDAIGPTPCLPPDLSGLRVLVAEDNLTNQTILRQLLGQMQADVLFVADGAAALELLDRQVFDIALIDIEMPRLSGLQVMQAVRARADAVAAMPMVALTAYVLRDNREAIYAAGADGIIGKPISSGMEFGRAILRYAGRPTGLPEPEDVLTDGLAHDSFGRKMDQNRFDALLEVAGADGAVELLERLHEDLCAVRDALDTGVGHGEISEIRAQTHILIAISGAVGADRLYRLAEVLNIAAKRRRVNDLVALYAPCRADLQDLIAHVEDQSASLGLPLSTS